MIFSHVVAGGVFVNVDLLTYLADVPSFTEGVELVSVERTDYACSFADSPSDCEKRMKITVNSSPPLVEQRLEGWIVEGDDPL